MSQKSSRVGVVVVCLVAIASVLGYQGCRSRRPNERETDASRTVDSKYEQTDSNIGKYAQLPETSKDSKLPAQKTLSLLSGFDSSTAAKKRQCVQLKSSAGEMLVENGHNGKLQGELVQDRSSLTTVSRASASASMGFGVYSADTSFDYQHNGNISRYADYFRIWQVSTNGRELYRDLDLEFTPYANKLWKSGNLIEFIKQCGDQFVIGQITGGSFEAIYQTVASSDAEQASLRGTLNASSFSGDMNAAMSSSFQKLITENKITYQMTREGPADAWPLGDIQELMKYSKEFPTRTSCTSDEIRKKTCQAPVISYLMAGYDLVQPEFKPEHAPPIGELLKYYRRLNDQLAGLLYINANANQFGKGIGLFDQKKLDEEIETTRDEQDKIREQAQECASGRNQECVVRNARTPLPLPTSRIVGPNILSEADLRTRVFKPIPGLQTGLHDIRVLIVAGEWNARNGANPQPATVGNTLIKFTENTSGNAVCYRYKGPMLVPPSTAVSIMVEDQNSQDSYNDNGQSANPLESYFYEPIFLEGLVLPKDIYRGDFCP